MSLARPYASKIYGLEGTIVEIHVTKNHPREPQKKSYNLIKFNLLKMYVTYIPNRKFDSIRKSVLSDITEI